MRQSIKIQRKKAQLVKALEKSLWVVTNACAVVWCDRSTFYKYFNEDPEFRKQCESIGDVALDFVETAFLQNVMGGNVTAQIFYLKTKGKRRGYVERIETSEVRGDELVIDPEELEP